MKVQISFDDTLIFSYVGASINWDHASDRRRFPRYCSLTGISLNDFRKNKIESDVIVLNQASDLTFWVNYPRNKTKIIFDANDSYSIPSKMNIKDFGRGTLKYLLGKHERLELNYIKTYLNMCSRADAVIVGQPAQVNIIENYNSNLHIITDFSPSICVNPKQHYELQKTINIFWEGLGSSFKPFSEIERIFQPLMREFQFKFHFLTDLEFYKISDKLILTTIMNEAKKMAPSIYDKFLFYQWNEKMLEPIATSCDIGIIPIPLIENSNYFKPENKLVLMWRLGLPTIVSATPRYKSLMSKVTNNLACTSDEIWRKSIIELVNDISKREISGKEGYNFTQKHYSDESLCEKWKNAIYSVFR